MMRWDTRVGTIGPQIPKLRQGSYFPAWLLEPRRRAEKALTAVVAEACLLGVSMRKVEGSGADAWDREALEESALRAQEGEVSALRSLLSELGGLKST